mgnify:CR=1 FL=1
MGDCGSNGLRGVGGLGSGGGRRLIFDVRSWTGVRVGESRARGPLNLRKLCVLVCIRAVMHVLVMTPRRLVTAAAVARISPYLVISITRNAAQVGSTPWITAAECAARAACFISFSAVPVLVIVHTSCCHNTNGFSTHLGSLRWSPQ